MSGVGKGLGDHLAPAPLTLVPFTAQSSLALNTKHQEVLGPACLSSMSAVS